MAGTRVLNFVMHANVSPDNLKKFWQSPGLRHKQLLFKDQNSRQPIHIKLSQWFSGIILACHAGDPGSIPGCDTPFFSSSHKSNRANKSLRLLLQLQFSSVVQLHRIFWHLAQRSSTRCRQFTHPGSLGEHIPATNFSSSKAYFISILWELFEGRTSCMFEVPEGSWCPPVRPLETSSSYQQATGRSFKHQGFWPKRACPSRSKPSGNSPHEVNRLWRWMPTTTEPESSWVRIELFTY